MRFALRYQTEYRCSAPVFDQPNVLRVKPATGPLQRVRGFRISVEPSAHTRTQLDYFGTEVIDFNIAAEHDRLGVTAEAEVTTEPPPQPPAGGWERTRGEPSTSAGGEFLLPTSDEPANGALGQLIGDVRGEIRVRRSRPSANSFPSGSSTDPGCLRRLHGGRPTRRGAGVCQDFAHLSLILLRRHGIAARHVSGYLFAAPEDGGTDSVEVGTDAWVEALLPDPGDGPPSWVGADPTNRGLAGETHARLPRRSRGGARRQRPDDPS